MQVSAWFVFWIVLTQGVTFAFYLAVTRVAHGWTRTLAAYAGGFLLPLAAGFLWRTPRMEGGEVEALRLVTFFVDWCAVTFAMSRGPCGRRLFAVLVCGVHQLGAFVFSLLIMHRLGPQPLGAAFASVVMVGMGATLVLRGIPAVLRMDEAAGWRALNLTAVMNFALLFATGFWPVYAPAGSLQDVAVFVVANVVAIVYFPVGYAFSEKNRVERTLQKVEDNTRVLLEELKSVRAVEEGARRVRHDTRHHVAVVREMLAGGRAKEADEYLANMCRHELLSSMGSRHWCENPLVDALLAVADRKAAACGKTLTATVDVAGALPFDEADIAALIGNLLENAVRHGTGDAVSASVSFEHGIFRLMVSNAVGPDFSLANGLPAASQGVGLTSVRQVVEKHCGLIGFEIKDGELVCKVVIGCA